MSHLPTPIPTPTPTFPPTPSPTPTPTPTPPPAPALVILTKYGDAWGARCHGFPPFDDSERWGWLSFKYQPARDYPGWPGAYYPVHGDMDGNGTQDLVQFTPYTDIWVALNFGNRFADPVRWGWLGFYYKENGDESYLPATGDFNGDGMDDLVQITKYGDAWAAIANGTGFNAPARWGYLGFNYNREAGKLPLVDDFDGDQKDDLAMITEYGDVWVALTGDGAFTNPARWGWLGFQFNPQEGFLPLSGDYNGDGRADLLQITPYADVWVALSTGASFENSQKWGSPGFSYNEVTEMYPIAADVNADGKTDLIQITPTGDPWVTLSDGASFGAASRWGWLEYRWSRTDGYLPMFFGY